MAYSMDRMNKQYRIGMINRMTGMDIYQRNNWDEYQIQKELDDLDKSRIK